MEKCYAIHQAILGTKAAKEPRRVFDGIGAILSRMYTLQLAYEIMGRLCLSTINYNNNYCYNYYIIIVITIIIISLFFSIPLLSFTFVYMLLCVRYIVRVLGSVYMCECDC